MTTDPTPAALQPAVVKTKTHGICDGCGKESDNLTQFDSAPAVGVMMCEDCTGFRVGQGHHETSLEQRSPRLVMEEVDKTSGSSTESTLARSNLTKPQNRLKVWSITLRKSPKPQFTNTTHEH